MAPEGIACDSAICIYVESTLCFVRQAAIMMQKQHVIIPQQVDSTHDTNAFAWT